MPLRREPKVQRPGAVHLFSNHAFVLLWSGQTISSMGDAFFNLTIMWLVYAQSGSALYTAIVQVIWQLSSILFAPFAGTVADRWNRKSIMFVTTFLSAVAVSMYALLLLLWGQGKQISLGVAFVTVLVLNSLNTFFAPARFSILPEIVGQKQLATASGLFTTAKQMALLLGNAVAGSVIALAGAAWALLVDAGSFLFAALAVAVAPLPAHHVQSVPTRERFWLLSELRAGWQVMLRQRIIRSLVWLGALINVASFVGPLVPALVSQRLHGGAGAYGLFEAAGITGGIIGGVLVGYAERRIGAGRLLCLSWSLAGICTLGMAGSTVLPLTLMLEAITAMSLTLGGIASGVLTALLVPENYRGRTQGTIAALNVIAIPTSALLGGWLTDHVGAAPLFAFGGIWVLGVAALAWFTPHLRMARV